MANAAQWLVMLSDRLAQRQVEMQKMDDYYSGRHPLPFLTKSHTAKLRDEFRLLLDDSKSNFMRLVVDVVDERLRVEGFRLSAAEDEVADRETWDIWQANQMDSESQVAFVESLVKGVSYLSVWQSTGDDYPMIAVEDASQTIVGYESGSNYRRRAAALKVWEDEWTGLERANVYLPDGIYKFVRRSPDSPTTTTATGNEKKFDILTADGSVAFDLLQRQTGWAPLEGAEFVENPLGVVPIVPLRNRPRLQMEGESELADVFRVQNQINGFLFLLALAGYFGAHRQRWAVGLTIHEDERTGKPVEPFNIAVDRLIFDENPEAKFGEFGQTDLSGYISAIEQKILHIAVTTRTPRHYLIEQGQSPSGDAIKSAESGLTKKVERKQRTFGEGLEEALRIARLFSGESDAPVDSEVVWADPAVRTEGEITDAAIKRWQANLTPWAQTMADLGYSATEINRMLSEFGGSAPEPPSSAPAVPVA